MVTPLPGVPSLDEVDLDEEELEESDDEEDKDDEEKDKDDEEESDDAEESAPGQLPTPKGTPALTRDAPSKSGDSN